EAAGQAAAEVGVARDRGEVEPAEAHPLAERERGRLVEGAAGDVEGELALGRGEVAGEGEVAAAEGEADVAGRDLLRAVGGGREVEAGRERERAGVGPRPLGVEGGREVALVRRVPRQLGEVEVLDAPGGVVGEGVGEGPGGAGRAEAGGRAEVRGGVEGEDGAPA